MPLRLQLLVQGGDALVVDAALADEHFLARRDRRRELIAGAPGPVTTTWLTPVRVGIEKATSFSRSGVTVTIAATMSTLPAASAGIELLPRHRHHHDVHLEVAGLQLRVQVRLELLQRLEGHAAFLALIDEVVRAIEGDADANRAALDHRVEIAGERLIERLLHGRPARRRTATWSAGSARLPGAA